MVNLSLHFSTAEALSLEAAAISDIALAIAPSTPLHLFLGFVSVGEGWGSDDEPGSQM